MYAHLEKEAARSRQLLVIQHHGAEARFTAKGQEPQKGEKRRFCWLPGFMALQATLGRR